MERLEPILKQKFWILLFVGVALTVTGWWMATGSMAATITTRIDDIKKAEGKVPSGEIPNDDWSTKLAAVNVEQEKAVKSTSRLLWERQRARMTWPESIEEFAWKNGYRGDISLDGRDVYRTDFIYGVRRTWETVRPFNRLDGSGLVDFALEKLPRPTWGLLVPNAPEMWDYQEDLWLLEAILQSIAEVNGGENSTRLDACIHVIERLTLHGGQPAGQRTSTATPGGGGGGNSGTMNDSGGTAGPFGSGSGFGAGSGNQQQTTVAADFDVKEEFGDEGSGGSGGAPGSGFGQSSGGAAFGGTGGDQTAAAPKGRRYIDEEDALPFKTRGFYLTVLMDHRKIPNLIAELSGNEKSVWPIEIVRVQVVRLHEDDIDGKGTGTGAGMNFLTSAQGNTSYGSTPFGGAEAFNSATSEGDFSTGFSPATSGSVNSSVATEQSRAALAGLQNALQDPYMARVALCGIITLYKEVKPEAAPAANVATPQPPPAAAGADSTATPTEAPAASTPTSTIEPGSPAETKPAEAPSNESTPPANGDTPQKPEAATKDDKAPAATSDGTSPTSN